MPTSEEALERLYADWSPMSAKLAREARRYLPGGDTRTSAHYAPYPTFMQAGAGSRLRDVDGHDYVDFMNNFTSLIHGHAHAPTVAAVSGQITRGSAYAAPTESQVALSRLLCERVPCVDELRFTSSGTEATNMCLRAARAFTGKSKIMKIEGGYHGSHEIGELSLIPLPGKAGPLESPETVAPDRSINGSEHLDVIVTPFNEPEITAAQLEERGDEIAALIVEPVMGGLGCIPPDPGYVQALRDATEEAEVLLVFDEVITLRLGLGGFQGECGVTPDLVAMAKIIGGGLPVGGFGGRRDIIEQFNPERRDSISHSSTFSGNALTMAAGLAALQDLERDDIARLNGLGDRLRAGFAGVFARSPVPGQVTGFGSLSQVHLGRRTPAIRNARESILASAEAGRLGALLHLGMLRRGIFAGSRGMYCISTPMGEGEIDAAVTALEEALAELAPLIGGAG